MDSTVLKNRFKSLLPDLDFCSIRLETRTNQSLGVRGGVVLPYSSDVNSGVMVTVHHKGGAGYASTGDLTDQGILAAIEKAKNWAETTAGKSVVDFSQIKMPSHQGQYKSNIQTPFKSRSIAEHYDLLLEHGKKLHEGEDIVDSWLSVTNVDVKSIYVANNGADIEQNFSYLVPSTGVRVTDGHDAVERSSRGDWCQQRGLELLDELDFLESGKVLKEEARELIKAPNCPSDTMDLVLDADQMLLQIHESIGHPLELDRILGDERNYAGTSFVTLDMFGKYQYGSQLLNISFDPTVEGQIASYGYDDDGEKAEKKYIIKDGLLKTPLGGSVAQQRAGIDGVANSRAVGWNRPTIDRMANLNLEPGDSSFEDLISGVERGIYMKTNQSWSIDDSRNKFQFGCQYGRMIENGKLTHLVKKPNYRGISASFWKSLKGVGDKSTFKVMGTANCGKGEPNQAITVGHAAPACLFENIAVFGGEA